MANTTSAINEFNVAVTKQSGKVGTVRYYQRGGKTYVRSAKNSVVNNPQTDKQMIQRLKFRSLQALYSAFGKETQGLFTTKEGNQTDANVFTQANQGLGVYFTKAERVLKYSCALPVTVSLGSLPEITCSFSSNGAKSNLSVGSLTISDTTTVGDLSKAIKSENKNWADGDKLVVFIIKQDGEFAKLDNIVIKIDKDSTVLLNTLGTFSVVMQDICYADPGDACVGFMHINSNKEVSKCTLAADADQQATIEARLTDDKFKEAVESYGKEDSEERLID